VEGVNVLKFEWDPAKAASNLGKHGVTFEDASSVFDDPLALTFADPDHSVRERRWLTFGFSLQGRLLVVSHTGRSHSIRLVSARKATRNERGIYERG
jgi:hypothetical protein